MPEPLLFYAANSGGDVICAECGEQPARTRYDSEHKDDAVVLTVTTTYCPHMVAAMRDQAVLALARKLGGNTAEKDTPRKTEDA